MQTNSTEGLFFLEVLLIDCKEIIQKLQTTIFINYLIFWHQLIPFSESNIKKETGL